MSDRRVPLLIVVGPRDHGVTRYAADVAASVRRFESGVETVAVSDATAAVAAAHDAARVHLHVTDRLFGTSPEEAARAIERIAEVAPVTLTLHDVPQPSDGTMHSRRADAYRRFVAAADTVAVNSAHEERMLRLIADRGPAVIPLGARVAASPVPTAAASEAPERTRDLVVLLAGYVYPGKGHGPAIRAAAVAASVLRAASDDVGDVVVRALGQASAGHEGDVERLRAEADALGVRFEITGLLDDDAFSAALRSPGVPVAAHEHVSASRSMLDWVEVGRRPLVVDSPYAAEMAGLRPGTLRGYAPADLSDELVAAWRDPSRTWLRAHTSLRPSLDDTARAYLDWWAES